MNYYNVRTALFIVLVGNPNSCHCTAVELAEQVGLNVKLWRIRRKLSQESLAGKLGIERQRVSEIELGKRNLTLRTLAKLAETLNCKPVDLMADLPE